MTTLELLSTLSSQDIEIWADGDRLRYSAPRGSLTPDLRKELAAHKSEILALLRQAARVTSATSCPLKPVSRAGDLALSFAQQRLWFLDEVGTSYAYNLPLAIHLKGSPNIKTLEESLKEIIRRHEALRTTFRSTGGRPVQVIAENISLEMPLIDLSGQPKAERKVAVERLARDEAMRHFDLAKGPLFKVALIRLSEEEHILLLTMHHIVSDGWSMGIFTAELGALYKAYSNGEVSPLPALPIQYADFAHWQREWLQGEVLENQLSYWREQLEGAPVLQLFTDRPRPAIQTFAGASQNIAFSPTLTRALNDLSQRHGVTLFMTLLAAFQTLLYRYTGQEDIVVGSPIANRNRTAIEGLIGFFVNTLAMRTDLSGNPRFLELLGRVGEVAMGAYAHQDLPFEKLVEELRPERDMSRTPLFQIMFAVQGTPTEDLQLPGLTLSPMAIERITVRFDIEIFLWEKPEGLSGRVVYNTDLFEDATIARLMGHYETLLDSIVADPEQRILEVSILSDTERQQMLAAWNDTSSKYPRSRCVHQLFEQEAEKSPDAVAVVCEDEQLTYRELNARANQLAHHLKSFGVGPEVLVGICLERSLEMIIAVLGILKAGAAYVPLDPEYPQERLAFMLADTQTPALLTQEKLLNELPESAARVVCLDSHWEAIGQESHENPISEAVADNLAYVMYTSGSTGRPKGVCVTHRNVVRLVKTTNYASMGAEEVFLQFAPISFDASTLELWGPLLNGGRLVVFPGGMPSLAKFGEVIAQHQVTFLWLTAGLFHQMVEEHLSSLGSVRQLLAGGDVLSVPHVKRVLEQLDGCRLINGYGPTENTTFTSCYPMTDVSTLGSSVPIGRPIANTQVYILDAQLQPVPIGVAGELYTGGDGLGRGYLNRPELTAEKFIPNPYSKDPAARLYKTGDLARYLPDGNIEFLGRIDHQVKIRGFRIELGEVENVLGRHPAVEEAVVIAREDVPGDKRLAAYVVGGHEPTPTFSELRRFLKEKLPDYMIPTAVVFLERIPLTLNGKVDRHALPAPDAVRPDLQDAFVAPRSQSEELVAGIWRNVLGVERIGVHDSFFELGGHSLLVVQIVSRIREVFEFELPVRTLFEAPTVAELTERIEAAHRSDEGLRTYPLKAISREKDLPLSFAQERLWFLHHLEPDSVAYSLPQRIRFKGVLSKGALEKAFIELARRHEILRTTFRTTDGNPVLCIADQPLKMMDILDLRHLPGVEREAEAKRLSLEDARKPFDLRHGPLLRIQLYQLEDEAHVLHFNMHHIISDGWSYGVMAREITALYTAFIKGRPADLPELTVQYADYAVWQRKWLQGEALEAQLNYWKDKLGGALPVLELPTDRPRPAVQTHRGAIESLALPDALSDAMQAMSRREGATLFMTLLTAFKTLLFRLSGQEDIVVGSSIANRNRVEIEGLIGFFVNSLAMRTDLAGQPTFRELLGRVRETALGAYAHQDMPFEKLVEALAPERDLSRTPLFQVFFNHIVAKGDKFGELPGLASEVLGGLDRESKFDMTLHVLEREGGIELRLVYNADLFDSWRMAQMLKQYQLLLEAIVSDADQHISEISLLTETERHKILVDWNDTQQDYASEKTFVHLFETQVDRSPDAIAVVYEDQNLTYKALNQRANQLAHHLRSLGVGPETVVGLCVERSFEMVAGLLGILKAGGAYVPLDPAYPQERLQYMLKDSGADMIMTSRRLMDFVKSLGDLSLISLDEDDLFSEGFDDDHKVARNVARPHNLAYVIYTSGSTGLPKGTPIEHKSLVNYLCWFNTQLMVDGGVRLPLITKLTFDASLKQLLAPLLRGDEVLIFTDDVVAQPARLLKALAAHHQFGLNCIPSLWKAIIDALSDNPAMLPMDNLSHLFIGGERLSPDLVNKSFATLPHLRIWNLYGPSETTANACAARIVSQGDVTIGRPIANTQIYILDSYLQARPIGVPGELHIGGEALARGYLNRPELTAEKFIPNPFSDKPGARLYKTGDLVRYQPDGKLEFLGRLDNQVKIRGYRIELGEIETTLCLHPYVGEAVVVAREDRPEDKGLVAYVVATASASTPSTGVLRAFLKEKLPDYMIPSTFVPMDTIPLTAIGKVDRLALPAPDAVRPDLEKAFVAPRNQSEELVAGIWSNVLGLERIGVDDSFFELGGHSLLVVQIVSRIRQVFEVELPVRALFEAPTVAELTERIEAAHRSDEGLQTYPLQAVSRNQDLPLSFSQERLWFLHHLEPDSIAYSMPRRIRLKGVLRTDALHKAYLALARRHEILRTTFHATEGNPVLHIAAEPDIQFETVDLRHLPGEEREAEAMRLSEEDARRPFDLARGPLMRIQLYQLEDEVQVLHFNMHHIVSDGWSFGVMTREITALYTAFIKGQAADLPELPVQYADYALWQRQWLQAEALEAQLNYWKDKLGGELPVLELPTDRPRPAIQTHHHAIESLALSKALSGALQAMSRREGVTLFITLLAAFKALLYRHSGQEDILVGTPIAGRNRTELEGLIGFFMNTIVMRTDLAGQPTFRELLGRVRETALGSYANQDMPFERLVEELSPERDLSRTPLFQVFFNHIIATGDKFGELPGLASEALGGLARESKFDMTLYVFEREGGIGISLVYNTDLFDASTIAWMLSHFETLLEGIAADPDQSIATLPLLTETTRQQLSTTGNAIQPTKSFTRFKATEIDQSLHARFMQQVRSYPDNLAVKTRKHTWTYAELNREANRIAQRVLSACGDQEGRIALLFGHDAPMIAGLLGVLKAGKTYVPLDPAYPVERLAYILEDADASAVLTDSLNLDVAQALTREKEPLINVDEPQSAPPREDAEVATRPDALAYILYTSGSTGRPKGVMQNHRNVMHFIRVYTNNLHISADDRLTLISSYSFDGAIMDIFGALLNGATLYPINIKEETAESVVQWLNDQEITLYHSTPTVYRYLLRYLDAPRKFHRMRLVVLGGEEVFHRDTELYQRHFGPDCLLINGLGPSESTVTLQYFINGESEIGRTAVPVGYPVDETEIVLLSDTGEAAEVYGEIAIRSPHIALGYWQQPELSDKVFLPDPQGGRRRIYRSGDMGRLLPDGSIEFAGRKDAQVKIRGIRIEVGEVEVVLGQHPAVSEVVVVPGADAHGERQLMAYLVISAKPSPSIAAIRGFLQQKLPDYMIPSVFMFLDALPRTPNGKVDQRALPEPDLERYRREAKAKALVAPRDALELQLSKIWENVLGVKNIGMQDNFFDLGGHSLLAVRLFARIQKIFGKALPLATLFQAPTIEQLASIIRQEEVAVPWSSLVPIRNGGYRPPFFCMHGCTGRLLHVFNLVRHLGVDQPFYGLNAQGRENDLEPHKLIEEMAAHYIKEIRTIQFEGPYLIGGSGAGCAIALEVAQQLESHGQKVALTVLISPSRAQLNLSDLNRVNGSRSLRRFFMRLIILLQSRPFMPAIKNSIANRILYRWTAFHRYIPAEIHRRRRFLKSFREARLRYTPEAYQGRITCILRDEYFHNPQKGLGDWESLSVGGLDVRFVPGTIVTMWREPHVQILADQLRSCIDEAQTNY